MELENLSHLRIVLLIHLFDITILGFFTKFCFKLLLLEIIEEPNK